MGLIVIYAISPILLFVIAAVGKIYPLLAIAAPIIFAVAMWNY